MAENDQAQSIAATDTSHLAKDLKEASVIQFKRRPSMKTVCDQSHDTSFASLERYIHKTQKTQEGLGTLMNPNRMKLVLDAFRNFDATWNTLQIKDSRFTGYLWGPMRFILEKTNEDRSAFDSVLEAYERLGSKVDDLRADKYMQPLVTAPTLRICLVSMYTDLLEFHGDIINLITYAGWKKAFKANWKDYSENSFLTILTSFDKHVTLLKECEGGFRESMRDVNVAVTGHVQRYEEDQEETRVFRDQVEMHQRMVVGFIGRQDSNQNYLSDQLDNLNGHVHGHIQRYEEDQEGLRKLVDQYRHDRAILLAEATEAKATRRRQQFEGVQQWISGPREAQTKYHKQFGRIRQEFQGTSKWILRVDKVWNWMHAEIPNHSVLRISGKKGAGKTILASSIIDECSKIESCATSYFYYRENDPAQNTCLAMCKALLQQMLEQCMEALPYFHDCKEYGEARLAEESRAKALMEIVCDRGKTQLIIIDGLDECIPEQRRLVIQTLLSLVEMYEQRCPGKVRVLLISTSLSELQNMKSLQAVPVFEIGTGDITKDIEAFATAKTATLREKFPGITENELEAAIRLLRTRSNGMFLFATLAMENLLQQLCLRDLLLELQEDVFPVGLKDAYEKILDGLRRGNQRRWERAKMIFGWLACAKRPLLWHELQAALSITKESDPRGPVDYRTHQLGEGYGIDNICGSLVQVIGGLRIEFIHQTARKYVLETETLSEAAIEYDLTILCLRYLSFQFFQKDLRPETRKYFVEAGYYAFQDYAISKWHRHIEVLISLWRHGLFNVIQADDQDRLHGALTRFVERYGRNMTKAQEKVERDNNEEAIKIRQRATEACAPFTHFPFAALLQQVWYHISIHEHQPIKERSKISLEDLAASLAKTRETTTDLHDACPPGHEKRDTLTKFYGERLHKCERVTCDLFFDGFDTGTHLKKHIKRHDRPFECPVVTCHQAHWSFVNQKDRDKHIATFHPDLSDQPSQFNQLNRRPMSEAFKHRCDFDGCDRVFTRRVNLAAHKLNHYGERPHVCMTCGRAFTRANDRARHDRAKHVRRA